MNTDLLKKHKYTIILTLTGLPTMFIDLYYWLVLGVPPEYEITFFIGSLIFGLGLGIGMPTGAVVAILLLRGKIKPEQLNILNTKDTKSEMCRR